MYEILQFRSALYLLVGLGFVGFTTATASPLMFVLSVGALLVNAFLIRTKRFRPMPRWLANGLTLAVAVYTGLTIYSDPRPIFPIGNFLVILQLIKLYEQRANRDYAQLLVLSLLLMVAAAISTAGLAFGITFIAYLLLSPYVCLLFHLKVEADYAKRLIGMDERQPDPITLRQDQRYLNRSMTRVTVVVAMISLGMSVIVFLFFPRVPGTGLLNLQFRPPTGSTGMSDTMDMQSVTSVQQNTAQVAEVRITHNGEPVTGGEVYLRGTVYDIYDGRPGRATSWSWGRSSEFLPKPVPRQRSPDEESALAPPPTDDDSSPDVWIQDFMPLKPIGVQFLPAMAGAARIHVDRRMMVAYNAFDGVVLTDAPPSVPIRYSITSTNVQPDYRANGVFSRLASQVAALAQPAAPQPTPAPDDSNDSSADTNDSSDTPAAQPRLDDGRTHQGRPHQSIIDPRIGTYARRPEVGGTDDAGRPLVDALDAARANSRSGDPPAVVEAIAHNIERHLQSQFSYTLDLGDAQRSRSESNADEDPTVRFLYDTKAGWCEHFATAMTLMCQSLGIQARIVSGYKVDEFNAVGGYFIVRQSHAHAWVEVLVHDGNRNVWQRFDPTGGRDLANGGSRDTAWMKVSHLFDYLEHVWANSVVAYDSSAQSGLLDKVEGQLVNSSDRANNVVRNTTRTVNEWSANLFDWRYNISVAIIVTLLCAMIVIAIGLISWYLIQRFRLTRRARRIGLIALGKPEARRMARQLGFYDELVRVLERRDIVRASHLTPLEFVESLSFLPREAYDAICRLTRIFYRVRYGEVKLTPARQRSLERVVERLRGVIDPKALHHRSHHAP